MASVVAFTHHSYYDLSYLKSPIIELVVGSGEEQTLLSAHQNLLVQSSFFSSAIANSSVGKILASLWSLLANLQTF